jgi:hypothetical protein
MPIRYAAAVGVAVIAAAVGAFLFIPQHPIAGTNNLARLNPVIALDPRTPWCQRLPSVPSGAGYVRIGVARGSPATAAKVNDARSTLGRVGGVGVSVTAAGAPLDFGSAFDFDSGRVDVALARPTEPASKGRICVSNLGGGTVSLYGEQKKRPDGTSEGRLAVTFLDAQSSTFFSRLRLIARRHGYAHAGAVGSWALALAALLMALTAALALWLVGGRSKRW